VLEQYLGDLWEYLTRWLSLRIPSETDKNRWRWDVDPTWLIFRESWGNSGEALKRVNAAPSAQVLGLLAQATGCFISVAAIMIDDVKAAPLPMMLRTVMRSYLKVPDSFFPKSITTDWHKVFNDRFVKFAGLAGSIEPHNPKVSFTGQNAGIPL
jgi:hypothetical protein